MARKAVAVVEQRRAPGARIRAETTELRGRGGRIGSGKQGAGDGSEAAAATAEERAATLFSSTMS